jgi:hypothetical protein
VRKDLLHIVDADRDLTIEGKQRVAIVHNKAGVLGVFSDLYGN